MGEFKGTPAPWEKVITKNGKISVRAKQLYPNRKDLFELNVVTGRIGEDDCPTPTCCNVAEHANANLIATAPELLQALQSAVKFIRCCPHIAKDEQKPRGLEKWEEIINKALG